MKLWALLTWDIFFRRGSREEFFFWTFKKVYIKFQSINQKRKQPLFIFFEFKALANNFFGFFLYDSITYIYKQLTQKNHLKFLLKVLYKCTESWVVRNFVRIWNLHQDHKIYVFFSEFFFYHRVAKGFQKLFSLKKTIYVITIVYLTKNV